VKKDKEIVIKLSHDGDGFTAICENLPVYGCGDSISESVGNCGIEIETYLDDLKNSNPKDEFLSKVFQVIKERMELWLK